MLAHTLAAERRPPARRRTSSGGAGAPAAFSRRSDSWPSVPEESRLHACLDCTLTR
jgi:hypothetical protein